MPNRINKYYVADIITFRGSFRIDGVAQTPDAGSAKIQIWKIGTDTAIVTETEITIASTQLQYKYTIPSAGTYSVYMYATFDNGADKRTGVIEFVARLKEAH